MRMYIALALASVAAVSALAGTLVPSPGHAATRHTSGKCLAIDGDTLVCLWRSQRVHIRLNGIDAPELAGHCRPGRVCAPGDPIASKANLASLIAGKRVSWRSLGLDRYGRTIAQPMAGKVDLGCAQLTGGFAIYTQKWDNGRIMGTTCPAAHNG